MSGASAPTRLSAAAAFKKGRLNDFFRCPPTPAEAFGPLQPSARLSPGARADLVEALRLYHVRLGILTKETKAALAALAQEDAVTVVAGQQAGLLMGPMYSLHKAADAILLARELQHTAPVVPIFWVASQDHDAEEVGWVTALDMSERLTRLELAPSSNGGPLAQALWQEAHTRAVLEWLEEFDAPALHKSDFETVFKRATSPLADGSDPSWPDVFARLVHTYLGAEGLILLDPMHPEIAALMRPILQKEIENPLAGPADNNAAAEALASLGVTAGLGRGADATNLFVHTEGGRQLLRSKENGTFFTEGGERFSAEELLGKLESDPMSVSPAAGLRPVVQDGLLPNVALVLGDGEIGYLAQLKAIYERHGVRQPIVWPRLNALWLEPNVARLLNTFELTGRQFIADPEASLGRALAKSRGLADLSAGRLSALNSDLQQLAASLAALDPNLSKAAERLQRQTLARTERLQTRAAAALARQENERGAQLDRLRLHLLPNGAPQEREMGFVSLLLKHGCAPLRQLLAQEAGASLELKID